MLRFRTFILEVSEPIIYADEPNIHPDGSMSKIEEHRYPLGDKHILSFRYYHHDRPIIDDSGEHTGKYHRTTHLNIYRSRVDSQGRPTGNATVLRNKMSSLRSSDRIQFPYMIKDSLNRQLKGLDPNRHTKISWVPNTDKKGRLYNIIANSVVRSYNRLHNFGPTHPNAARISSVGNFSSVQIPDRENLFSSI